jgi:decaprenylphospho-beta-D-ribofuranose 2-oxidase
MRKHRQIGWGKTHSSTSVCYTNKEFTDDLRLKSKFGIPIGLGRSYGDSSINSTGVYLEVESEKKISINSDEMFAMCDANVSIGDLERAAIEKGFFPPTVPGTEFVTIGGAIASNIHGKSHHYSGAFGDSVLELELLTSTNEQIKLSPKGETSRYFWATIGGMGLTGVITKAKINLNKIETSYVLVEEKRAKNLNELFDLVKLFDNKYLFTVAWIDLSGKYSGRGIVSGGNHAKINELNAKNRNNPFKIKKPGRFVIPNLVPSWVINSLFIRIFNFIWFIKPLQKGPIPIRKFLHPLDSVRNWNNIYGRRGLIQFQFQIPFKEEHFINNLLLVLKQNKVSSFLGVLKKFGDSDPSLLGFPTPGWTLAIDFPAKRTELIPIFQSLSKEIANLGGKVYLTKDAILLKEDFKNMYKENEEWRKIKNEIDPFNYWSSDQGVRLGLC